MKTEKTFHMVLSVYGHHYHHGNGTQYRIHQFDPNKGYHGACSAHFGAIVLGSKLGAVLALLLESPA